jgi:hypothetical protein
MESLSTWQISIYATTQACTQSSTSSMESSTSSMESSTSSMECVWLAYLSQVETGHTGTHTPQSHLPAHTVHGEHVLMANLHLANP